MKKYLHMIIPCLMAVSMNACGLMDDIVSSNDGQTENAQSIVIDEAAKGDASSETQQTEASDETTDNAVEEIQTTEEAQPADALTLEQKVGQLFIVRPDALDPSQASAQIDDANSTGVTELTEAMRESLAQYPVGGVCQFSKNIVSPEQFPVAFTYLKRMLITLKYLFAKVQVLWEFSIKCVGDSEDMLTFAFSAKRKHVLKAPDDWNM